jgi:predicted XRE-type DNA-binding protein
MKNISHAKSSGNVFADLGFNPAATADLTLKCTLITTISDTIKERELTQLEAAQLCGTD